jgi:hypothetical protein
MRAGLVAAYDAAGGQDEGYPKDSVVLCAHCFLPLYVLTCGIVPGQKANRTVHSYRPITELELWNLRAEVPSVRSALMTWTPDRMKAHVQSIPTLTTGDAALCPCCSRSFVQIWAPEEAEVIDRAYTWRLVTIPPRGELPVRRAQ